VEHSPIEITPTHARPALHELVLLWIDDMNRQTSRESLEPIPAYAVDMDFKVSAGEPYSHRLREVLVRDITDDGELGGTVAEQILDVPRSKGPAAAKEMDCFEEARLASPVGAIKVVPARSQVDIDLGETADRA
jgi:hypothetical protein